MAAPIEIVLTTIDKAPVIMEAAAHDPELHGDVICDGRDTDAVYAAFPDLAPEGYKAPEPPEPEPAKRGRPKKA